VTLSKSTRSIVYSQDGVVMAAPRTTIPGGLVRAVTPLLVAVMD